MQAGGSPQYLALAQVNGRPFHFAGFNNYYLSTYLASPECTSCAQDVDAVFQCASVPCIKRFCCGCLHILCMQGIDFACPDAEMRRGWD